MEARMKNISIKSFFLHMTIVILVALSTLTVFFVYNNYEIAERDRVEKVVRAGTTGGNSMISALNDLNNLLNKNKYASFEAFAENNEAKQSINEFTDAKERVVKASGVLGIDFEEQSTAFIKTLYNAENPEALISSIGDYIRKINTYLRETNAKIKVITETVNLLSFFVIAVIFSVFIFSYVRLKKHFNTMDRSIEQMNLIIKNTEKSIDIKPSSKEGEEIRGKLDSIEKKLLFQNKLLNYNSFGTLETVLPDLFPLLKTQIDIQRLSIAFVDNETNVVAETVASERKKYLNAGFQIKLADTTLSSFRTRSEPRIINDLEKHYEQIHQSPATRLILKEGYHSSITAPIYSANGLMGFLFVNSTKKDAYNQADADIIRQFTQSVKGILYSSYLTQELIAKTATAFADLVEKKDFETGDHLMRVAGYSKLLAEKLSETDERITPKLIREIFWFAPLHDIGKVGIPKKILLKPARLTSEEYTIMKEHVNMGVAVMKKMNNTLEQSTSISFLETSIRIISEHHEKWNGKGYPGGLKGEEISIPGRIVAVADVFDALISKRVYKPAFSTEKAFGIIEEGLGTHFCPTIGRLFLDNKEEIVRIMNKYKD